MNVTFNRFIINYDTSRVRTVTLKDNGKSLAQNILTGLYLIWKNPDPIDGDLGSELVVQGLPLSE